MSIRRSCTLALAAVLSLAVLSIEAATFTVSKAGGGGQFSSIQAAVDKAGPGDIVKILDVGTYAEQVTIDSLHNNLTLTSANPTALNKPRIVWNDRVNVKPKTCAEAQNDSNMTFDQNGALRLMWVHGVVVNGIAIDGGGVFPFASTEAVWNDVGAPKNQCRWYLQHGNSALDLYVSGDIIVKNCDITNSFIGVQVKDRNSGGIFANANPGDNTPWLVVPLSGFARTGNHLIEHNRVHDNSYGFWCESVWDLGSTIRYNLIFNNHDPDSIAKKIHDLTSTEGPVQSGGAFLFKDDMYTPFAIYNNTFWHNFLVFQGSWRPGVQHLIFNNIYGTPYHYWTKDVNFPNSETNDLSPKFTYRMNNCVYSAQSKGPPFDPYYTPIMNGIQVGNNAANLAVQGNLMNTTAFPAAANIRWVEMDTARFLSVNQASAQFLEPNWTDSLVNAYIKDAGWAASGVVDPDGTPADLGAIPSGGGDPVHDDITIKPTMPVSFTGTTVTLSFDVAQRIGGMTNPKITLFRYVKNLPNQSGSNGGQAAIIPAANIITVAVPVTPVKIGANSFNVTMASDTGTYSFFELTITGTGSDGKPVSASVGFIPYRKLDYKFVVQVWNFAKTIQPDTVRAGDTVWIRIIPQKMDNTPFTQIVNPAKVWLQSGFNLLVPGTQTPVTLPAGVSPPNTEKAGMFTRVPQGGMEYVLASGQWTSGTNSIIFLGSSKGIVILSGPPEKVVFQNPPSKTFGVTIPPIVDPGSPFVGTLKVYDKWGNSVNSPAYVTLKSLSPSVGNIVGDPKIDTTDLTGTGTFGIIITGGTENQSFLITGNLPGKNTDTAEVMVGKPRDRLWIFYSDTAAYAPAATLLQGQVGDRLKITIMAGKSARLDSITKISSSFTINGSSGLLFYSSPTAPTPSTSFTLAANGRIDIWVTSLSEVTNGTVTAVSDTNLVLSSDTREKIFFIQPKIAVDSAFYYADNPFGRVTKVEIYYKDTVPMAPDSIALFWPLRADANKQLATGTAITLNLDKKHVTVTVSFPIEITTGDTASLLGTTYQKTTASAASDDTSRFTIKERVGPLLMTAQVVENLTNTIDTLYVTFSEGIKSGSLVGASLLLIKNGVSSVDTVTSATLNGSVYKLVLSPGSTAPKLNDSLSINPTGPVADAIGNKAHDPNRPVVITQRSIPASITSAYYQDRNADGTVETVVMKFNKKVTLSDLILSLDWGSPVKADSINVLRLAYQGTDSMTIEINTLGVFPTLSPAPRTSGGMNATVGYRSISGLEVNHDVADSAAPVLDSAVFHPGKSSKTTRAADTLWLDFSEPLGALNTSTTFLLKDSAQTPYTLVVNAASFGASGTHRGFLVTSINGVTFPSTGDSIWIDPASHISDVVNAVQLNPNNRKVVLHVLPVPYDVGVELSTNPFVPGKTFNFDGIQGSGILIEVAPKTPMKNNISVSATGRIYDAMGNLIMDKTMFQKNTTNNKVYLVWDGRNRNGRYVGTGTYLALVSWTKDNTISSTEKKMIGVKR